MVLIYNYIRKVVNKELTFEAIFFLDLFNDGFLEYSILTKWMNQKFTFYIKQRFFNEIDLKKMSVPALFGLNIDTGLSNNKWNVHATL